MPYPPRRDAGAPEPRARSPPRPVESLQKPLRQPDPDLVLLAGILPAMVEVGIVVDLDDEDAVIGFLEVDAVEAVADAAGGTHRRIDDMHWGFLQRERLDAALVGFAGGLVVDDLPVFLGHQIVHGKERLAAEHADAPVIFGRDEF